MKRDYTPRKIWRLFAEESKNDPTLKRDTLFVAALLLLTLIGGVLMAVGA